MTCPFAYLSSAPTVHAYVDLTPHPSSSTDLTPLGGAAPQVLFLYPPPESVRACESIPSKEDHPLSPLPPNGFPRAGVSEEGDPRKAPVPSLPDGWSGAFAPVTSTRVCRGQGASHRVRTRLFKSR